MLSIKVTSLTPVQASLAKGMIARGDRQSDIAAYFGVNGGRISEINTGKAHQDVPQAASAILPPAGPYPVVFSKAA
jgi:hypothetical protein